VFFVKGEQFAARVRTVPPGQPAATAAMHALLAGPTAGERASGVETKQELFARDHAIVAKGTRLDAASRFAANHAPCAPPCCRLEERDVRG
jgi:hypothetical protein